MLKWDAIFSKKEAMIKAYGKAAGEIVHIIAYTVLPIVAGSIFIFSGLR